VALAVRRSGPNRAAEGSMALSRKWKHCRLPLRPILPKCHRPMRGKLWQASKQPQSWSDWLLQPLMAWQSMQKAYRTGGFQEEKWEEWVYG
jgi:hypothetical protein